MYKPFRIPRSIILVLSITIAFTSLLILISTTNGSIIPTKETSSHFQDIQNKATAVSAHYIVFEMALDGTIHPLSYQRVQLSEAPTTMSQLTLSQQLQKPERNAQQLAVKLKTSTGKIVYQNIIQQPRWLRGEFHGDTPESPIDGHHFPLKNPVFVVRVPAIAGTSLVISDNQKENLAEFNLDQLVDNTPQIQQPTTYQFQTKQAANASGNRVDLLIMGDGYTTSQETQFYEDANHVAEEFFTISPFAEYQNYFITHTLFTASNESGADHPPCDGESNVHYVDTAFDAKYCSQNFLRLLTVNVGKVLAAAAAVPEWDEIIVIVNDTMYGGSGGTIATVSMHNDSTEIAQHEFGHTFVNLADEYESSYPYPSCSDISGPSCEINVTDVITRSAIKWNPWISPTIPIPTVPEFDPAFANVVGLFEGARYKSSGMYRSGQSCIMRTLGRPFCQVPSQAFVLILYNGGWGVPASGISMIEPDSLVPASNTITLTYPYSQQFHADILQPIGGPPAKIQWLVNGVPIPNADADTFTYTPDVSTISTDVEIQLLVEDTTSLVHPDMAGNALNFSHTWIVSVVSAPVTSLTIDKPAVAEFTTDTDYSFIAIANATATTPITYSWQATGHALFVNNDETNNTINLNWNEPGAKTITVAATNIAGDILTETVSITVVHKTYRLYLPIIIRQ